MNEKEWIVEKSEKELIKLVSKGPNAGIVPIGTILTIENKNQTNKHVLRVEKSTQKEIFAPSTLLIEANLSIPGAEKKCRNIIFAKRIYETNMQKDDCSSFIEPGSIARRANQNEINKALRLMEEGKKGVPIFIATSLFSNARILKGKEGEFIIAKIPEDAFYHQMIIAGKTGAGKTNALKYLIKYFVEELEGAVIALNVKGKDLLFMDRETNLKTNQIEEEWRTLNTKPSGIENFSIFVPYKKLMGELSGVDKSRVKKITLSVEEIEPEALIGLMYNLSGIAESILPDAFRFWKEKERTSGKTFNDFVKYLERNKEVKELKGISKAGNENTYPVHPSTFNVILREVNKISGYFDQTDKAKILHPEELVQNGNLSVLQLSDDITFGSVLLRDIIKKIQEYKIEKGKEEADLPPVLFIIDETHLFYNSKASEEALSDLKTICRTGRQYKMGIIFASQNPRDIPNELASVVGTKIFFKSEKKEAKAFNIGVKNIDIETLPKGFAAVKIHGQPFIKIVKFPLTPAGDISG